MTPICGAKTKSHGGPCGRPAGWGTDHVGLGRCKLHGGNHPIRNPAAAIKTEVGRYRLKNRPKIKALLEEYANDPDPMNVLEEVALARALLHDRLERTHETTCPKCKRSPDEESLPQLIELVSRVIGRIEHARNQKSIAVAELVNLVNRLALVVKHHVADPEILKAIAADWHDVGVSITTRPGGPA